MAIVIVMPTAISYTKSRRIDCRKGREYPERGADMPRTVSIGCQDFETIRRENYFYIDKSCFIKEWWERGTA